MSSVADWYAEVACWTVGVVECGRSETKGRCGSMLLFCRHSWPQLASYTSHNIAHRRILYTSREQSWSMWHWSRNVKHWPYSPFSNPEFLPFNYFVASVGDYLASLSIFDMKQSKWANYTRQEARESFAFSDKLRINNSYISLYLHDPIISWETTISTAVLLLDCCKKPFLFPFNTTT